VLDVGTGTGTVAALAGSRGASVVAVDADPGMVELARSRIGDVRVAALPSLPFEDGEFDAAVANFVINHVGSPLAAVAEMRRVVRRGGRVAVTVWPFPAPTAQRLWSEIFDAAGVPRSGDLPRLEPADDFARTPDGLSELLTRAGLTEVRATSIDWIHRTDPEAWWSGPANGLGTPGLVMLRQPPATIARIRQQFGQLTAPYLDADGRLALPTSAVLGVGVA
jgi:ubiquinone/menaquinone biosynthesis C-methylase UbiE